jgi:hypothetical protein
VQARPVTAAPAHPPTSSITCEHRPRGRLARRAHLRREHREPADVEPSRLSFVHGICDAELVRGCQRRGRDAAAAESHVEKSIREAPTLSPPTSKERRSCSTRFGRHRSSGFS